MAFGRGKVILLGEHSVVYGRPALAAGIERGVTATAEEAERDALRIDAWDLTVEPDPDGSDPLARAFAALLATFGDATTPVRVTAEVGLPPGAGLGCSAALGVAVAGAVAEALGSEWSADRAQERSLAWERVFHGNPSGIDSAMAAHGGVAVYTKGEPLTHVDARRRLRLVVGHSGEASSTKAMVDSVARQWRESRARVDKVFDGIASLVRNGELAVRAGDHRALGQLLDLNQALLSSLLLSTTRLEDLCAGARDAGALGAKLTGAGGGGCMFALAEDDEAAASIVSALESLDARPFVAEVR